MSYTGRTYSSFSHDYFRSKVVRTNANITEHRTSRSPPPTLDPRLIIANFLFMHALLQPQLFLLGRATTCSD